ncbi:MAG: hypothetical protein EOO72_09690, partial [Myxococcaceae bacterium]
MALLLLPPAVLPGCDRPRPAPVPPPPPVVSADHAELPAPDPFAASPFRVVAEGANGDDEHDRPLRAMCPVKGAILVCGHGPLLHASATAGLTVFDPSMGSWQPRGQWPSRLWALSSDEAFTHVVQQTPGGWVKRARLGVASSVSMSHRTASWGDGGLAVLTSDHGYEPRTEREYTLTVIQTISRDGAVVKRALTTP